jgi:hypothetical protein
LKAFAATAARRLAAFNDSRTAAWLVLAGIPVIAFWAVLISGERTFFAYPDDVQQFYPWLEKLAAAIHRGYLPLWDANSEAGYSFAGEIQTGVFYPPALLLLGLFGSEAGAPIRVLEALVVLHFVLASVATYAFCRQLGVLRFAAAAGAIAFAYAGPFSNRAMAQTAIFFTDAYVPVVALCALLYVQTGKRRYAVAAGVATGFEVLAGHLGATLFSALLVAAVAGSAKDGRLRRLAFALGTLVAVSLLTALPQVFFGGQRLLQAYRAVGAAAGPLPATAKIPFAASDQFALHATGLLSLFDPWHASGGVDGNGLFVGACVPAAICLCLSRREAWPLIGSQLARVPAFYLLAPFALLVAAGSSTPFARLWYALPVIGTLVREPGRYALLFQFVAAAVFAVCIDALARSSPSRKRGLVRLWPFACAVCLVACYASYIFENLRDVALLSGVLLAIACAAFFLRDAAATATLVLLCVVLETGSSARAIAQPVTLPTYAPRVWAPSETYVVPMACYGTCRVAIEDGFAGAPANLGDVFPLQTISGYTALFDSAYRDFIGADPSDAGYAYDLLNVEYLLSDKPLDGFQLVSRDAPRNLYLYRRATAFPRAYSMTAATRRDLRLNDVTFSVLAYSDLEQRFRVTVPREEVVVFAELFYPGWAARIDGTRVPLLVARLPIGPPVLRALRIPAGSHDVRFVYPR